MQRAAQRAAKILLYLHPTHYRQRGEYVMTFIQQFIEKALVGGWQPADRDFRIIGFLPVKNSGMDLDIV